ncbi:hypothetical protein FRB90_012083 [Tulasnella sp. 427]|nr:hypothetical protein FRB90_012083 [Tulasnella sp. 427]
MAPRAARAAAQAKNRQQAQDRDSPASLDVPNPANGRQSSVAPSNPRKRAAQNTVQEAVNKRKRVESAQVTTGMGDMGPPTNSRPTKGQTAVSGLVSHQETPAPGEGEERALFDLSTLPLECLRKYMLRYELVPPMYPSPHTHHTPPLPSFLVNPPPPPPPRSQSPPSQTTLANRPRRDLAKSSRRSTRLAEDEQFQAIYAGVKETRGPPIRHDLWDMEKACADIAQRHWDERNVRESEVVEEFIWSIRSKRRYEIHVPVDARPAMWNAEQAKEYGAARVEEDAEERRLLEGEDKAGKKGKAGVKKEGRKKYESDEDDEEEKKKNAKTLKDVRLRSERVKTKGDYFIGVLRDGQLYLHPISQVHQFRPTLTYMDVLSRKTKSTAEDDEEGEEENAAPATAAATAAKSAREVVVAARGTPGEGAGNVGGLSALRREMISTMRKEQEERWVDMQWDDEKASHTTDIYEDLFSRASNDPLRCTSKISDVLIGIKGLTK